MRAMILAVAAVSLSAFACSSGVSHAPLAPGEKPRPLAVEATEKQVEGCEFLRTVYAGRGIGATVFSNKESLRIARYKVLKEASDIGGTHVVILDLDGNAAGGGSATARAFRCPKESAEPEPSAE